MLADLRAVSSSENWRSEEEARFGGGEAFLVPLAVCGAKPISH